MTLNHRLAAPLATLWILALAIVGCRSSSNDYVAPPPPEVVAVRPLVHSLTDYLEEVGETEAVERAEVRSRVQGFIESVDFQPGQKVTKGDVLYQIEDDEYVAAKASADAELSAAEASISVAKATVMTAQAEADRAANEVQRQKSLLDRQATSQAEYDNAVAADNAAEANLAAARSQVEQAEAAKLRARARLDDAERNLGYTQVKAPISGSVTATDVKLGNLVDVGTGLAEVVDDSNVYVNFSISDRQLLEFFESREADEVPKEVGPDYWRQIPVEIKRETDKDFPFQGSLDYVAQEGVSVETGTLQMRGIVANQNSGLVPGLFVRVRIPMAVRPEVLLIPELAVGRDRVGDFVLVVDGGKVRRQEVVTGQRIEGWIAIDDGLSDQDLVIVEGIQRARPGIEVTLADTATADLDPPKFRDWETTTQSVNRAEAEAAGAAESDGSAESTNGKNSKTDDPSDDNS